jgi:uncharacterized membrane protein
MEVYTPRWLRVSILVVALIGFLDAVYLTANHYLGVVPPCFVVQGCEQVTTSSYSLILGIPVALLGSIYYLVIFALAIRFIEKKQLKEGIDLNVNGTPTMYVNGTKIDNPQSYEAFKALITTEIAKVANKAQ